MPAGPSRTVEITFTQAAAAGELEFACHVAGHCEAGVRLPITIVK